MPNESSFPAVAPGRGFAVATAGGTIAPGKKALSYMARPETPKKEEPFTFSYDKLFENKRPSLALQHYLGYATKGSKKEKEDAFIRWLNTQLKGYQFSHGVVALVKDTATGTRETMNKVEDLNGALSKIFAGDAIDGKEAELRDLAKQSPEDIGKALAELFKEIGDVTLGSITDSLEEVKTAASSVVDSIPYLGTLTAAVKLIIQGVQLGVLVHEAYRISKIKGDSISIIEIETLGAIQYFEKKDIGLKTKDMVGTAATGVASYFGAGAISSAAITLISLLTAIVLRIIEYLEIKETNQALKSGTLTMESLRTKPLLGLHLPHIYGVDSLVLLGILPAGWRSGRDRDAINTKLQDILYKQAHGMQASTMGWLRSCMDWDNPSSEYHAPDITGLGGAAVAAATAGVPKKDNPWRREYQRILYVLEKTDKYLYSQSYALQKNGLTLHKANPTSLPDKAKEAALKKLKSIFIDDQQIPTLPPISR